MLPAPARMRSSDEFSAVVRRGRRAGSSTVVVHALRATDDSAPSPRVGFIVNRQIGNAVDRNTVRRRLRHVVRERLAQLPRDSHVVVRALPRSRSASPATLRADLDRCLAKAVRSAA